MRVLHVTPTYLPAAEWGGVVLTLASLVDGQRAAGAEVTVLTTNARGAPGLPEQPPGESVVEGVRTVVMQVRGSRRFAYARGLSRRLRRLAAEHDIVHVHGLWTWSTIVAGRACRAAGVPYVLSPHGMLLGWALSQKSLKKRLFSSALQDRTLHGAATLHYTTERERAESPPAFAERPSVVIPNAIRVDDLLRIEAARQSASPLRLLIAGRIHAVKGFDRLIPALAVLRRRGVAVRLTVAGGDEGGYRQEVERAIRRDELGESVEFAGLLSRAALVEAYREAAILVMPSYQENFGMSAAEAMAAARPVIVTRAVNLADEIEAAGAGLVSGPEPEALASAVETLAGDPARRAAMGAAGRGLVSKRFAPAAVASEMLALYGRVTGG